MMLHNECNCRSGRVYGILIPWAAAVLCLLASQAALAQSGPIPEVVKNIPMGSSAAIVTEKIQGTGTYTTEELPKEHRSRLVWVGSGSPYFKNINFTFTEKDRLCIVRFTLNDAAVGDYPSLKRAVFKDYDFSWDKPLKLKIKDQDIALYATEKGMTLFFLEFTDRKTHEKAFELFDRSISATDRVYAKAKEPTEGSQPKPEGENQPELGAKPDKEQGQADPGPGAVPAPAVSEPQETPKPEAPPADDEEKKPE